MKSSRICSQCMRTLRIRLDQESSQLFSATHHQRPFSTQGSLWLQKTARKLEDLEVPPQIPTTAGTVTSNVTAVSPNPPPKPKAPTEGPSVTEMQRRITNSLSRPDLATQLAKRLRKTARSATESYITYGLTENLFLSCAAQAPYTIPEEQRQGLLTGQGPPKTAGGEDLGQSEIQDSWWFNTIGLQPTFSAWSQVTYLHMYALTVRLRALDNTASFLDYQRYLLEHFSHAAEDKMIILHNMSARGIRNRYLKDLFLQWRGILAAYDEGLVQGDAVLAGAVWRNLFKGDENVDWEKVALVVAYLRKVIYRLGQINIEDVAGSLRGPSGVWALCQKDLTKDVRKTSRGISEPLTE